jgi:hypothetical protein
MMQQELDPAVHPVVEFHLGSQYAGSLLAYKKPSVRNLTGGLPVRCTGFYRFGRGRENTRPLVTSYAISILIMLNHRGFHQSPINRRITQCQT